MADPLKLSQISCVKCKERKVKCDRIQPKCSRCERRGAECVYPHRSKRRPVARSGYPSSVYGTGNALATILERLQRVENKCVSLPQGQPAGDYSRNVGSARHATISTESLVQPSASSEAVSNPVGSVSPWSLLQGDLDAASTLQSAIDEVEKRVHRQAAKSVVRDAIHIPKELARTWVESFFRYMHSDTFVSLIDRKLIELMPDLLEMNHVYLDGSITFVYYTVLYFGCSIAASTTNSADIQYRKAAYICCLRALPEWQREATGSTTDLIAALSMVMICAESFNSELGWQMHKLACEYAQRLNLQSLDMCGGSLWTGPEGTSDGVRKSFWELIQIDLFIRLVFDKPPRITATTWNVNMPWLTPDSQPQEKAETTLFLCGSRITLILMRFFSMFDMAGDDGRGGLIHETDALCREIQELYAQGQLGKSLVSSAQSEADIWKTIDATMIGYTCIIFMLRKARMHALNSPIPSPVDSDSDRDLTDSPIALDTARDIIKTSESLLTRYPWPTSVAALFGAFQIQIAYTVLFNNAIRRASSDRTAYAPDIRMLRSLGESIIRISSAEEEFAPLVHAVRALNTGFEQL